jgi:hypothetical protein
MPEFTALAQRQLDRVKVLLSQVSLKYIELPPPVVPLGVGVAVGFGEVGYVTVSVMGALEDQVMITSGILKDIRRDRLAALSACNQFTSANTQYPVYLLAAEDGWSLLTQRTFPVDVMFEVPAFFSHAVRSLPSASAECRATLAEQYDLGGRPWAWNGEDVPDLLFTSMMS